MLGSESVVTDEGIRQHISEMNAASNTKELKKRTVILPVDPEEALTAEDSLLQLLGNRFYFTERGQDRRDGIDLRIRLYEDTAKDGAVKQRIEMKPRIGRDPSVVFIWRF